MEQYEINDIRNSKDFKKISFSGYQKNKVKIELIKSLLSKQIESACYWSAELICAGHFADLWEIIILYLSKHIQLGNPKLPIYIDKRFAKFKDIISNGYIDNEILLRNNINIRQLFGEIISVLCLSKQKLGYESVKINKKLEFDMLNISNKLEADSLEYASNIYKSEDPKDFFVPINEFAYHISDKSNNSVLACYWLEWLIEYNSICRKKEKCECERRTFAPVNDKFQKEIIWIVWDVILYETKKKKNKLLTNIINSLLNIYSIKFTAAAIKRRKYILYFIVSLFIDKYNTKIEIIENIDNIQAIIKKLHIVYKEVKKGEIAPKTDYLLMNNDTKSNLDKTIAKLDKMKAIEKNNANNSNICKYKDINNDIN